MKTIEEENIAFYNFKKLIEHYLLDDPYPQYSQKEIEKFQDEFDDLVEDFSEIFLSLKPEELLSYLIKAHSHGFYLDSFYPIIQEVLKEEKHFDVDRNQDFKLMALMNELSKEESLLPILNNYVKSTNVHDAIKFCSDTEGELLTLTFLHSFAENYAWAIELKEKSFLWPLAVYSFNSEFAQWLSEKNVAYDNSYHNETAFNSLMYYNINTQEGLSLISVLFEKEIEYKKTNNINEAFKEIVEKTIVEANEDIFKFLVDKGFNLSNPSFDYYFKIIDENINDTGGEEGQRKIREIIAEKEKDYLNASLGVETLGSKKQLKI